MSTITLRIPDAKHERLKQFAKERGVSLNRLLDELATIALAQYDAETRFKRMGCKGDIKRGLDLLDKLDKSL